MNRIVWSLLVLCAASLPVLGQDAALVERVNRLSTYVDELLADKARQQKQIADLTREVSSLREQLADTSSASARSEEIRTLARKIQEVDDKRKADTELILKEIEKLGKSAAAVRSAPTHAAPQRGYEYTIQKDDTISAVAAAYREQGIRVTADQIVKANPGLDPRRLQIGQTIFIPAP